jgi:hypothetical protein
MHKEGANLSERMVWLYVGLAAVWGAVLLVSLLAPDLVSGSQHEHLPLPAMLTWLSGVVATGAIFRHTRRAKTIFSGRSMEWISGYVATCVI